MRRLIRPNVRADRIDCSVPRPHSSRCQWMQMWLVHMAVFTLPSEPQAGRRAAGELWIC